MLLICCGTSFSAAAQYVTQSAEGKGTVILPLAGTSVGFDIGKTEISVGANNYTMATQSNNSRPFHNWFIGANLAVKNSAGTGNLFKNGEIIPEGNFLGFLGFSVNNNQKIVDNWNSSGKTEMQKTQATIKKDLLTAYRNDIVAMIEKAGDEINDPTLRSNTVTDLKQKITGTPDGRTLNTEIKAILATKTVALKDFVLEFSDLLIPRKAVYTKALAETDATKKVEAYFKDFAKTQTVWRVTPFLFGGIEARNFSLYKGLSSTSLPSSFIDTLYRGGQFGVGVNLQVNTFWLGVTYAYVDGDNFSGLNSKEYTLRTTDNLNNQSLIAEKKITGYSGAYSKVKRNELNIDLMKEFNFSDTSRIITDLYYRGSLFSRKTDYLKDYSNLGLGIYFLGAKAKFLGGLYVEVPDLNNNIEKAKPALEQNIRGPFKRLTFGVVTKFAIASVFGFKDRVRTPD